MQMNDQFAEMNMGNNLQNYVQQTYQNARIDDENDQNKMSIGE